MREYELKYGGGRLRLKESEEYIAIKVSSKAALSGTETVNKLMPSGSWQDGGLLGGFRVIRVDDEAFIAGEMLDRLRLEDAVDVGTHVFEAADGGGLFVPTGELYVKFVEGSSNESIEEAFDKLGLMLKEARDGLSFIVQVTQASPSPVKSASYLQDNPLVEIAEPDLASLAKRAGWLHPSDPRLADQWHLHNAGHHYGQSVGFKQGADARVKEAWEIGKTLGDPNVVVAVIDDGFDLSHPDFVLAGKITRPWDFTRNNADPSPGPGDWHGTACAGVAVAASGAGDVIGAAPNCQLMPIRWGRELSDGQVEAWFKYAEKHGAAVVSCSWKARNNNFPLSSRMRDAIKNCATNGRGGKGCVVVFAAGNDNSDVNNPASGWVNGFAIHQNVIAVAASTSRDQRSHYSNFGVEISICAPSSGRGGWGILTSDVTGVASNGSPRGYAAGDYTDDFGGTSSACPLVAGVAALVLSVAPELTASEVKELLQKTARKVGDLSGYNENGFSLEHGFGCVDAGAAISYVLRGQVLSSSQRSNCASI